MNIPAIPAIEPAWPSARRRGNEDFVQLGHCRLSTPLRGESVPRHALGDLKGHFKATVHRRCGAAYE